MLDERTIRGMFYDALRIHCKEHNVDDSKIIKAVTAIQHGYAAKKCNEKRSGEPLGYDDAAFRCAYLYKYASCHTSLIQYVLKRIGPEKLYYLFVDAPVVKICCIGGGPGSDIIGLCAVFHSVPEFWHKRLHFDVVDCMLEWRMAYASVESASCSSGSFGIFLRTVVTHSYHRADMLSCIPNTVKECIRSADLVTMVKFVSATASGETAGMLQAVFTMMKPSAAVLFIDNAGGGYHEHVSQVASRCGLVNFSGPFHHLKYQSDVFKCHMFGSRSLTRTTVTVQMWKKTYPNTLNGWASLQSSQSLLDSQFETSSYGCSYLLGALNQVDVKEMKQDVQQEKLGNPVLCDNGISKELNQSAFKTEISTSQSKYNSATKVTGSTRNGSSNHVSEVKSQVQLSTTSMTSEPYPKQCNTNNLSGHSLCTNSVQTEHLKLNLNQVGVKGVKQNVPQEKSVNPVLCASDVSKTLNQSILKTEISTSQSKCNSLTKMTGSSTDNSDNYVSEVKSQLRLSRTSVTSEPYPKQGNTSPLSGHALYANSPQKEHVKLSDGECKNVSVTSGIAETDAHYNSSSIESNLSQNNSSFSAHSVCTDKFGAKCLTSLCYGGSKSPPVGSGTTELVHYHSLGAELKLHTSTFQCCEVQDADDSLLCSASESPIYNRMNGKRTNCCIIL